ncbi:MAG TPA: ABC transporter transmembrane domain-containing protein [Bacteroidales bacterium]|nr:MAG: Lipid A export ATP-binding/permease protein MsbA [Bacteroidetes bacterium ADurb.Bin217]HPM12988.1 ABC transporter transmembrane domain-containing protein [Bacteroidales bacterium]
MRDFIKLIPYLRRYKKYIALNVIFNLFGAIFSFGTIATIIPFLSILFNTNEIVADSIPFELTKESLQHNSNYLLSAIIQTYGKPATLLFICGFLICITLLKNIFEYLSQYFNIPVVNGVPKDLYNATFDKILHLPIYYFTNERKGDIMARMSSDITEVRNSMVNSFTGFIKNPLYIVIYFAGILIISWQMTLIILILLPITAIITGRIGKNLKKALHKAQHLQGDILVFIDETLSGLKVIKVFNGIGYMQQKFKSNNYEYYKTMNNANRKHQLAHPITESLIIITLSFAIFYGGSLVLKNDGSMSAEGFITFLLAFTQIVSPAKAFTNSFYGIKRGAASIERIEKILHAEVQILDAPNAKSITTFEKDIEFKNVSFSYTKERPVLQNISIKLEKGKSIALVGQSGSGKTTIAHLLPRFYEVEQGDIVIDGISIKDIKLQDLRNLIGIVTQDSILFNDTIFNNIAFGIENADEAKVIEAAKLANAHDFIMETPLGYHTNIGDQGGKLSGGQRQRISIARAIMKNPQILLLDEATSALDTESERLVQNALEHLMKDRTSLIIAHRLSTIKNADQIIVLQDGAIVEQGTHNELVALKGAYQRLHSMQIV